MDCVDIIPLVKKNDTICEIGCRNGISTEGFLQAGAIVYTIDPWKNYDKYHETVSEDQYYTAHKRLSQYGPLVTILRMTSIEAFPFIPICDLVWIDGNHAYEYILQDIELYWKKVRPGGYLSGDDYQVSSVKKALEYYVTKNNLNPKIMGRSWVIQKKENNEESNNIELPKDYFKLLSIEYNKKILIGGDIMKTLEAIVRDATILGSFTVIKAIPTEWEPDTVIARCYIQIAENTVEEKQLLVTERDGKIEAWEIINALT